MVLKICVVKSNNYIRYEEPIIQFGNSPLFPSEFMEYFDALTTNFNDLGYWDDMRDLHGLDAEQVKKNIQSTLSLLKQKGYKSYDKEPIHEYLYTWEFGRVKVNNSCMTENMPDDDRVAILIYHLENLLKIAESYDQNYYFFVQ